MAIDAEARDLTVLAIPGSLRRASVNRRLLELAAGRSPRGMSIRVVDLEILAGVPPFNEDLESIDAGDPAPVLALRMAVQQADGLLISTPEYNQSIPGVLKNHIDWLSRDRPQGALVGKPVAVMGATTGDWGTRIAQSLVRQALMSAEALVMPPNPAVYVRHAEQQLAPRQQPPDDLLDRLTAFLGAFGAWMERCQRPPG